MSEMSVDETIRRIDHTRRILMSGDGEWSDAEEMDMCVTSALHHLRAMQWRIKELEAQLSREQNIWRVPAWARDLQKALKGREHVD